MPYYLRTPPAHKPVFARLTRHGKFHAFYSPFGWPIRLCTWEGIRTLGEYLDERRKSLAKGFRETADAPTCKHCIRDLRTVPGQTKE
jgi:hypothetical protein